jgi:cell division protein FtsZ
VAAEQAISSQLLDITINGARGVIFNVTGGPAMSLFEVNEAAAIIKETAHPDVNLIFGAVIDPNMGDEIRITVIATGFEKPAMTRKLDRILARPDARKTAQQIPLPPGGGFPAYSTAAARVRTPIPMEVSVPASVDISSDQNFEIPTFLRGRLK